MELVFATHNHNKFKEVQKILPPYVDLVSLEDIGCHEEIPETGRTLEENAQIKVDHVTHNYGLPCFSDDSGLLVEALNGAPGVYSARYAGPSKDAHANMDKLLKALGNSPNRNAHFKTVVALRLNGASHLFQGVVHGTITTDKRGAGGFGYDPIFKPIGYDRTFAQLPLEVKNEIGHRGRAIRKLVDFLSTLGTTK